MRIAANQFKGLLPALDARQVSVPFVLDGRNFYVSMRGPRTAFGGRLYSQTKWGNPAYLQTMVVGDELFMFAADGVYRRSSSNADFFYPIYMFSVPVLTKGPWTAAYVGSKYYFCKPGSGVIQYDPVNYKWRAITTDVATGPVSVTQAGGRLIILAAGVVQWSAIDDGENLAVDPDLGVGAQLLAFVGGGTPLRVKEISDGFVTYTDRGVMHSQTLSGSAIPFRHRSLQNDIIPIDSWSVVDIDRRVHIVLARTGFYIMGSASPESWNPLFGEYLREEWLNDIGGAELYYNPASQLVFISLNQSNEYRTYSSAFVCFMNRPEEWGRLNHAHFGLLTVAGQSRTRLTAMVQPDGYLFTFSNEHYRESSKFDITKVVVNYPEAIPAYSDDAFGSVAFVCDCDPNVFATASGVYQEYQLQEYVDYSDDTTIERSLIWAEPFYDGELFDDDTGFSAGMQSFSVMRAGAGWGNYSVAVYSPTHEALDSEFTVGLFRVLGEAQIDRLNDFYELVVHSSDIGDVTTHDEDWNQMEGSEDWNLLEGTEDWGMIETVALGYDIEVFGTFDGVEIFENNIFTPEVKLETTRSRVYHFDLTGYYLAVTVKALEPHQGMELRGLEIAGQLGGRL